MTRALATVDAELVEAYERGELDDFGVTLLLQNLCDAGLSDLASELGARHTPTGREERKRSV